MRRIVTSICLVLFAGIPVMAGEADVVGVEVTKSGNRTTFSVTVSHADDGWEHYADGWEVVGPDGTVLGKRV